MARKPANTIRVAQDLKSVTQFDPRNETAPSEVGLTDTAVKKIWAAVEDLYRTGTQPAITLALRRHGKVVLNRAIGHAHGNGPQDGPDVPKLLATTDTPICLFSASKAITAMLVHKLAEEGALSVNDLVSRYLPEYADNGKQHTTLRHLLSHRAGIPTVPVRNPDPSILYDWDGAVRMLCAAKAVTSSGETQAYHAITAGYILGEVIRRVTGRELRDVMTDKFRKPLGFKYFNYGLEEQYDDLVGLNYFTGPKLIFPLNLIAKRALGIEFEQVAPVSNDAGYRRAVIPAGNIYATADECSRFYQMMLNEGELDGVRIFTPETVRNAIRPAGVRQFDRTLVLPIRFSQGMLLGERSVSLYGVNCEHAYGHLGFIQIVTWADPQRELAAALLTTGKPMEARSLYYLSKLMWTISTQCTPARRARPAWKKPLPRSQPRAA
ncbi:MAG: serine hydrolase domain-containing protein [Nevskiales bacterium]